MKDIWKGFGTWTGPEGPMDEDDPDSRRWVTECSFLKLELAELADGGGWLAFIHDVELEKELKSIDFESAKKEAVAWVSDILRAGLEHLDNDPDEVRFKQIAVGFHDGLFGITESGVVYQHGAPSGIPVGGRARPGWRRLGMRTID